MELPWQADHRHKGQHGLPGEPHRWGLLDEAGRCLHPVHSLLAQPVHGKQPHRHQGQQLDDRFKRHGQHQAGAVLGGIHLARAEQNGKQGHDGRHIQGRVVNGLRAGGRAGQNLQADGYRLVLQGQIGHGGDQRDQRHPGRQPLRAAKARADEVGNRHCALRPCHQCQPLQHAPAQQHQQQRPQVNRQVAQTIARRRAHRAVKRPRGAIHGQGKAVHHSAQPGSLAVNGRAIAYPGHGKEHGRIQQRNQHHPAGHHGDCTPCKKKYPQGTAASAQPCVRMASRRLVGPEPANLATRR